MCKQIVSMVKCLHKNNILHNKICSKNFMLIRNAEKSPPKICKTWGSHLLAVSNSNNNTRSIQTNLDRNWRISRKLQKLWLQTTIAPLVKVRVSNSTRKITKWRYKYLSNFEYQQDLEGPKIDYASSSNDANSKSNALCIKTSQPFWNINQMTEIPFYYSPPETMIHFNSM